MCCSVPTRLLSFQYARAKHAKDSNVQRKNVCNIPPTHPTDHQLCFCRYGQNKTKTSHVQKIISSLWYIFLGKYLRFIMKHQPASKSSCSKIWTCAAGSSWSLSPIAQRVRLGYLARQQPKNMSPWLPAQRLHNHSNEDLSSTKQPPCYVLAVFLPNIGLRVDLLLSMHTTETTWPAAT